MTHGDNDVTDGPRRTRSGRVPQWALDEYLERHQAQLRPPALHIGAPNHRLRKRPKAKTVRRRLPLGIATGVGLALITVLYVAPGALDRLLPPAASARADGPPAGVEASDSPLGMPPEGLGSDQYRLQASPDPEQSLIAFDPCRPIHYVVSGQSRLPGGDSVIREAVAEISAATGLRFIDDGETDEKSSDERSPYQPDRYGDRWAPVLIAWSSPEEIPDLTGSVAGLGGGQPHKAVDSPWVFVSGQIDLDTAQLAEVMLRPGGASAVRSVVTHELGHVLGLGHVNDPTQLMYGGANSTISLGDGDRAGLARIGRGPCVPEL
ncbi:matrixin family metalloprotease [Arthrobacter roseus]|uniref:matrixin family metalloprotease n=1 Tax=Arthrobacter roseus TaxID=136274 RepID=UPI0019657F74|nr:matrixin family metalloprotease [Arthrobacter roseus]MBM7846876.1 hypothetical protein [Arthrobacter roseus]